MLISFIGHSCFKIQYKSGPDGVTVVTDPYDKDSDGDGYSDKAEIDGGYDPLEAGEGVKLPHGYFNVCEKNQIPYQLNY